jgi:phenylalanyl-tRNA synthetase beta chain
VNVFGKTIGTDFFIQSQVSDFLSAQGFREILNNSLISKDFSNEKSVKILNPLSEDLAVMRQSMIWGGLESMAWNLNRQISDIQMYEFGKVYFLNENGKVKERKKLALWVCGNDFPQNWVYKPQNIGFFLLKSNLEKLLSRLPLAVEEMGLADDSELAWGIAWKSNNQIVARMGLVKSELCKKADIKSSVYYAEIDWEWIVKSVQNHKITFKELPKFPTVRRDISLQLNAPVSFTTLYQTIKSANPKLIRKIALFDLYENKKENFKSYAFSIYMSDDNKTLTDETVDKLMERMFGLLEKIEGVVIRKA